MTDRICKLDDHPIIRIGWTGEPEINWVEVGVRGVTKIDAIEQYCGEELTITWLQVWQEDELAARFNAKNVDTIHYKDNF